MRKRKTYNRREAIDFAKRIATDQIERMMEGEDKEEWRNILRIAFPKIEEMTDKEIQTHISCIGGFNVLSAC